MKLHLDYAVRPDASPVWVWGLLVVGVLGAMLTAWASHQLIAERDGLRLTLQSRTTPVIPKRVSAISAESALRQQEQLKQANLVLRELGRPWPGLFDRLEAAAGPQIALLQIKPEAGKERIRLMGEARTLEDALDYVRRLSAEGGMQDVMLEQHQVVEDDAQKPVRFSINARWNR